MRVITGKARGKRLQAPPGLDTRPTTDLAKEGIFSAIQFEIEQAMVLDLFAGSGQCGIEALSRGAAFCVFVDQSRQAQQVIKENLQHTGLYSQSRVVSMDAFSFLASTSDRFDIAFLDPPYHQGILPQALEQLVGHMSDSGMIVCEYAKGEQLPERVGEFCHGKEYSYGKTRVVIYRKEG